MNIIEFLHMGGYAAYVWPAYGIVAVVLLLNLVLPLKRHRRQCLEIRNQTTKNEP